MSGLGSYTTPLLTELSASLPAERTHAFILSVSTAGDEASLAPTGVERAEAEALPSALRAAFLARRRLLRRAVALRLGIAPGDVLIAKDAKGALRVNSARKPVFASLASRGALVAIGISDRPVGVDVELIDERPSEPAWNILHARERAWLSDQGAQEQAQNFLALWCAKEAYLKALGLGLRREPAEIAVSVMGEGQLSIEDSGGPVALDSAFVTRCQAHGAPAVLACLVLAR